MTKEIERLKQYGEVALSNGGVIYQDRDVTGEYIPRWVYSPPPEDGETIDVIDIAPGVRTPGGACRAVREWIACGKGGR